MQEAAAGVLGCTEVWKRGNHSVKPAASLLWLIAALDELPVAQMLSKSWEKSEPGEQPACLASWGMCLLLRHPLGILLLALHGTLFDSLSPAPSAAKGGQEGWHAGRSCAGSSLRLAGAHLPQLWQFVVLSYYVTVQHADSSPATSCTVLDKAGGVQKLQLFCMALAALDTMVSTCSTFWPTSILQAPHWMLAVQAGTRQVGPRRATALRRLPWLRLR